MKLEAAHQMNITLTLVTVIIDIVLIIMSD